MYLLTFAPLPVPVLVSLLLRFCLHSQHILARYTYMYAHIHRYMEHVCIY